MPHLPTGEMLSNHAVNVPAKSFEIFLSTASKKDVGDASLLTTRHARMICHVLPRMLNIHISPVCWRISALDP